MNPSGNVNQFNELMELVRKRDIHYRVWPYFLLVNGVRVQVGFELELRGIHDHVEGAVSPGCIHCVRAYEDLLKIAQWIMPSEDRPSTHEIEHFDHALRYLPKHDFRPEVTLTIKTMHRDGFDQPVDACEEACVKEMRKKLIQLGVPEE